MSSTEHLSTKAEAEEKSTSCTYTTNIAETLVNYFTHATTSCYPNIRANCSIKPSNKGGDYQYSGAMAIAGQLKEKGQLKENAKDIAINIVRNIPENKCIDKLEVAGPGFVNIYLQDWYKEFARAQPPKTHAPIHKGSPSSSVNVVSKDKEIAKELKEETMKSEKGKELSCATEVMSCSAAVQEEMSIKKTYQCPIDVDYPESEEDKLFLRRRVEEIVTKSVRSSMDLAFIKECLLEEYAEEIACLGFEELELENLPWSSLNFEVVEVKRGSTIMEFTIGFNSPPQSEDDLSTNRVIELVVLTIIENLPYIKGIKEREWSGDNLELSAKFKVNRFDENNYEEIIKHTLRSLRGSLKFISSGTPEASGTSDAAESETTETFYAQRTPNSPRHPIEMYPAPERSEILDSLEVSNALEVSETTYESEVDKYLLHIFKHKSKELKKLTNLKLTPLSMRRIAKVIKDEKLTEQDLAKVTLKLVKTDKRNRSELLKADSSFLFPYNFRKLADLEPQIFQQMVNSTTDLPNKKELWYKFLLPNLFGVEDMVCVKDKVDKSWPYPQILIEYKKHGGTLGDGGTLGGLLDAMEKFENKVEGEKEAISTFVAKIVEIRKEMSEALLSKIFFPGKCSSIQNFEEFKKMARNKLKVKTNPMQSFQSLRNNLQPGHQLWIYHERPGMSSYAHVVIIVDDQHFVHATGPGGLHALLKSKIKKEDQNKLTAETHCFAVNPIIPPNREEDIFCKRAISCLDIYFDYDPQTASCETFCNGVHGIWEPSIQGQDIRGLVQHGVNRASKVVLRGDEKLTEQMEKRFQERTLLLPNEAFPSTIVAKQKCTLQ